MKRISKLCALLFCAMLWLNPVGAQQFTRIAAERQDASMDGGLSVVKENPAMQRHMDGVPEMLPLLKQSDMKSAGELQLSDQQKEDMVKASMQQMAAKSGELVSPFIGALQRRTVLFDIVGNEVSTPKIVATWLKTSVGIAYPAWGAWCGDHFEGFYNAYQDSTGRLYYVSYMAYDPDADKRLGTYTIPDEVRSAGMAVYDMEVNKIYAIKNVYNANYTAVTDIVVYEAAPLTGAFVEAGHITDITSPLVAAAISKEGVIYVISTEGKLYTVNKEDWTSTLVGETGIPTATYNQSAAIDPRTNTMYWGYVEINPETGKVVEIGMATVNTSTAEVNKIETRYYQMFCMASIYYMENNPMPVDPFGLSYNAAANQVVATFVAPDKTVNGLPLTKMKAIRLYSVDDDGLGEKLDSVMNPEPGRKYELTIDLTDEEGMLAYAIQVEDTAGVFSEFAVAEVMILNVELPYTNGFEEDESDKMLNIVVYDPQDLGGMERTDAEKYTGDYSFKMTGIYYRGDFRKLNIQGIPVKKGGIYQVSFWAKTNAETNDGILYAFDGAEFKMYVGVSSQWRQIKLSYEAAVTGQMSLTLQGYGGLADDRNAEYFIDDVEIKEILSPNVPSLLTINNVTATEGNALSAVMNITLPSFAVSDEPLASISGIVVHYSEDASFEEYKTDSLTATTVGETADFTVGVEKAGQYYFRAYAYNEFGRCPEYSIYSSRSPWIGPKNMPVSMATATVNDDGDVEVSWTDPAIMNEISWTVNGTMYRRLTIDNKSAFKYAQAFDAADLASYGMATPKALQLGFVPGSETAEYTLVLAYEGTEEVYRKAIDPADLREGEWYYTNVDSNITIDVARQLWLIVEVAASENQGYACAVSATTVADGKSNKMLYNNSWTTITKLFTIGTGSVLVSLKAEDPATTMAPDNGYKIYRGKMDAEFEDYDMLATVTEKNYIDQQWKDVEFGRYKYAVVAVWEEEDATPVMTNVLNKDMEMTVTFAVSSNAGSTEGAEVAMIGMNEKKFYTAIADAQGKVVFEKVWRDVYAFDVVLPFHEYYAVENFDLVKDTVIKVALTEIIVDPELTACLEGKNVVVNYGVNLHNWFDDVESHTDFAIANIDNYILSEPVTKITLQGYTWTNYNKPQSWIVLNSEKTTPAFFPANSGSKFFMALRNADGTQNNDYLIRSVSKGGGEFVFRYRVANSSYPESFEVVYSSTTADLDAFKVVKGYGNANLLSWTEINVSIPEDARFVGIRCSSDKAVGLLIDDLAYYTEESANPTGYELYLDDTKVKDASVNELTYTFEGLSVGEHKVGVKAVYASGFSELVEKTVTIVAEAAPINLNAAVEEDMAVLTWDIPEGFAPKAYKVYLGEELKAENLTEKAYTFTGLENGEYVAAVVAVYETGESQKETVAFKIETTGMEALLPIAQVRIYPNPNNGVFYLRTEVAGVVEVYTLTGQKLQQVMVPDAGTYGFNLNRARGMYLVKFVSGKDTRLLKMVVR